MGKSLISVYTPCTSHDKVAAVPSYLHLFDPLQLLLHLLSKGALQFLYLSVVLLHHGILSALKRLRQLLCARWEGADGRQ